MSIDRVKENQAVIERIESFLTTGYESNPEFNAVLNGEAPISIRSLKDQKASYSYEVGEILYWVDRASYLDELESWNGEQIRSNHSLAIAFLEESHQEAVLRDLVDAIRKRRVAPFIGAGVSSAAGYPLWGSALKMLIAKHRLAGLEVTAIEAAIDRFDFLEAAQQLYEQLPKGVDNFIHTEFRLKNDDEPEIKKGYPYLIELLPRLSSGCVVTTNFDKLIETFLREGDRSLVDGCMLGDKQGIEFVHRLLNGDRCILKLHGEHSRPDTHVFTREQYERAYGAAFDFSKELPKALRQIYISNSLLFVGCSLEQDRTLDLFAHVIASKQFEIPKHFAFLPDPKNGPLKQAKENRLLELNIQPIWYRVEEHDHSMLTLLVDLAVDMAERKVSLK
ncbi:MULTISPECIES: SIR2 family protein [Pseudomonas]|jgi:hypothetical protein|uniref:SIR2 family protein n=1 Tax=Pseudomonas TaxID=286 RepID=UPI001C0A8AD5|nr:MULTISPECIES: SIR2 family protein [Pseudomonas]MCK3837720.1 hypothetical protein [Pseudomonas sp. NCIMB 10586]VCU65159.1 Hypothetical new protein [Pseudomonas synxantha]